MGSMNLAQKVEKCSNCGTLCNLDASKMLTPSFVDHFSKNPGFLNHIFGLKQFFCVFFPLPVIIFLDSSQ